MSDKPLGQTYAFNPRGSSFRGGANRGLAPRPAGVVTDEYNPMPYTSASHNGFGPGGRGSLSNRGGTSQIEVKSNETHSLTSGVNHPANFSASGNVGKITQDDGNRPLGQTYAFNPRGSSFRGGANRGLAPKPAGVVTDEYNPMPYTSASHNGFGPGGRGSLSNRGGTSQIEVKLNETHSLTSGVNHPANFSASGNVGKITQDGGRPKPSGSNYVPEVRDVCDLFKEDAEHAMSYQCIADEDEAVAVSGVNMGRVAVIEFWKDAGFEPKLLFNIVERAKYTRPRKIQSLIIPFILEGRDVKGHAETGGGKTAAFMLPIINAIMKTDRGKVSAFDKPSPYAIIVEPSRELCAQVYEQGRKFAFDTGVFVAKAYGQYNMRENMKELQVGCDILCATPGRLKHLIQSGLILLTNFKYFVLDEADHLLEGNFLDDVRDMFNDPNFPPKEKRQNMLFSATFPELIQKLSSEVLREDNVMVSNKKLVSTNSKVTQNILLVPNQDKKSELLAILKREQDEARKNNIIRRTIVFVRTKRDTDLVSIYLTESGIKATTLHGDRTQGLREKALRDFRNAEAPVLVTTDVCARGIDIKDLEHVINFDMPGDAVTYVHRIGRTGRIKHGLSTSFFDEYDSNDCNIAKELIEFLEDVKQTVPEFLKKIVSGDIPGGIPAEVSAQDFPINAVDDGW